MSAEIAIILAAGMGSRLGDYTRGLPKGMLPFAGKPLIAHQVSTLRQAGIDDIVIVTGYEPSKIDMKGLRTYHNPHYATTNMVASLLCAEEELKKERPVLVGYADIIYGPRHITTLLCGKGEISVLADEDWIPYWQARNPAWQDDIESLQIDPQDKIFEIGTPTKDLTKAPVRYIGLNLFHPPGIKRLLASYHSQKSIHSESTTPWRKSRSFKQAYMTCMLQHLIDEGADVFASKVQRGWLEFDTVEDYERALLWNTEGTLGRFLDLAELPP